MGCGSHRNNRDQQAEVKCLYQKRLQAHLAKDNECKYQFYWWSDFKMLPPDDRCDYPTPWDRGWEHLFDCLDLAAKEVLYHFYAFCIVFPDRTIRDFMMTSRHYLKTMLKLRHNAVGPPIHNKALRRTCRLELFMQNNPRWFDQSPGGKRVIHEVQEEVLAWPNKDPGR